MTNNPIKKIIYHTIYIIAKFIKLIKKPWSMRYISVRHAIRKTIRDKYYFYDHFNCPICHQQLGSYTVPDYANGIDRDYSVCGNPGCPLFECEISYDDDDKMENKNWLIERLRNQYGEHTFPICLENRLELSKHPLSKLFWKLCIKTSNLIQSIKEDYNEYLCN